MTNTKYHYYIIILLILLLACANAHSQPDYLKKDVLQVKDGISDNRVSCIFQDSKGLIWFGTQKGLNKYDGYNFIKYYSEPLDTTTLSDNDIIAITEDIYSDVWVATFGKGINRLNQKTGDFKRFTKSSFNKNSLVGNTCWDIKASQKGNVWIATDMGISKYSIYNNKFDNFSLTDTSKKVSKENLSLQAIYSITIDNDDNVWFGGDNPELHKYNETKNTFERYNTGQKNMSISALFCDDNGIIWIGTNKGYFSSFDTKTKEFKHLTDSSGKQKRISNNISSISEDDKGNIWVASWGSLCLINKSTLEPCFYDNHKSDESRFDVVQIDAFNDILQDKSGVIWLASRQGVAKLTERTFYHYTHQTGKNSISSNYVTSFAQDSSGQIWIGTDNGLNSFDPKTELFSHYLNLNIGNKKLLKNINSLLIDSQNTLWVGNEAVDLCKFDINNKIFTNYGEKYNSSNLIFQILEDNTGNIWTLSNKRLISKFTKSSKEFHKVQLSDDDAYILSMSMDKSNNLWFGTFYDRGLFKLNTKNKEWKKYLHNDFDTNSLCQGTIYDIFEDSKHNLWIATDNGLNKITHIEKTQDISFERFDKIYPNNTVFSITEDNSGKLWLRLMQGIALFDPENKTVKTYGGVLPLGSGDEWKVFKSDEGSLYLAGTNGFVVFDTKSSNQYISPVVLTRFTVNKEYRNEFLYAEKIELDYNENSFSCKFAALDYTNPTLNQYSYYLEGVDLDWIFSGTRRYINYTNLEPGNYILHLKGSNSDGLWNEVGLSIPIIISPPFWETLWYYLAEIIFFGMLLTLTVVLNRRSKVKHIAGLSFITILTLLVIFEFVNVTVEPYVEGIAGGVPVFKLVLNLIIAVLFFPLEKLFIKTMKNKKLSMKKDEILQTILKDNPEND